MQIKVEGKGEIPGLFREPGLPSPTIMALEGIEPSIDVRRVWEQRGMLGEYANAVEFKKGLDQLPSVDEIVAKIMTRKLIPKL